MQRLEGIDSAGTVWENNAKKVLEKQQRTLEDLKQFVKPRWSGVPIDPAPLNRLVELKHRGKECEARSDVRYRGRPL